MFNPVGVEMMGETTEQLELQEFVKSLNDLVQSKVVDGLELSAMAYALTYVPTAFIPVVGQNSIGGFPLMFEAMASAIGEAQTNNELAGSEQVQ